MADDETTPAEGTEPEAVEPEDAVETEPEAAAEPEPLAGAEADAQEPVAEEKPKAAPKKAAPKKAAPKKAAAPKTKSAPKAKAPAKKAPVARKERKPIVRLPKPESERGKVKERRGTVVSSAMDKTIVVRVDTVRPHPAYKKVVRRSAKFHAHDEQNAANVGDVVRIVGTRPRSKTKSWRLAEILEVAK